MVARAGRVVDAEGDEGLLAGIAEGLEEQPERVDAGGVQILQPVVGAVDFADAGRKEELTETVGTEEIGGDQVGAGFDGISDRSLNVIGHGM